VVPDPIVRVREGGVSIPIFSLPFVFDYGVFPEDPDGPGTDCQVNPYTDPAGTVVSCAFQNLTGEPIGFLDVSYTLPPNPGPLVFSAEDLPGFFAFEAADSSAAIFQGGGIPSGSCELDGEPELAVSQVPNCFGGEFLVDVIGFPNGTEIAMTAAATAVPEPTTIALLVSGLAGAALRRRRRA
jgi:hypothetical protein